MYVLCVCAGFCTSVHYVLCIVLAVHMCRSMCCAALRGQSCRVLHLHTLNPALPCPVPPQCSIAPPRLRCRAERSGVARGDGTARALTAEYQCAAAAAGRAVPVRAVGAVPAAVAEAGITLSTGRRRVRVSCGWLPPSYCRRLVPQVTPRA